MNRNLDGTELTNEQLEAMLTPETVAKIRTLHGTNLIRSGLLNATAEKRFELMSDRKLMLDSRTPANTPVDIPPFDELLVAALRALLSAVIGEREDRLYGESSEGGTWSAEMAIDRLAAHVGSDTE